MRTLLVAVVVMGVLIVAGVAVLGVTMVRRLSSVGAAASVSLEEPAGTEVAAVALSGDRLAVQLRGGGPDRVVVIDGRGAVVARVGLTR